MYDGKLEELKRQLKWEIENELRPSLKRELLDELRRNEPRDRGNGEGVRHLETRVQRLEKANKELAHQVNILLDEMDRMRPEVERLGKKVKVWTD